jgi:hypothetical protein
VNSGQLKREYVFVAACRRDEAEHSDIGSSVSQGPVVIVPKSHLAPHIRRIASRGTRLMPDGGHKGASILTVRFWLKNYLEVLYLQSI